MNILKKLMALFSKKISGSVPLLILRKNLDEEVIKEYNSVEEAIADLENDPDVSSEKIKRLKIALRSLKNKTTIKIINGEVIK
ncbi:MAG: hypothetical protein AB1432_08250 [Bacteroidota bacterium]|jgi:hypothetical protein